jgi:hypothetical protein
MRLVQNARGLESTVHEPSSLLLNLMTRKLGLMTQNSNLRDFLDLWTPIRRCSSPVSLLLYINNINRPIESIDVHRLRIQYRIGPEHRHDFTRTRRFLEDTLLVGCNEKKCASAAFLLGRWPIHMYDRKSGRGKAHAQVDLGQPMSSLHYVGPDMRHQPQLTNASHGSSIRNR